jgi:hypothetical protein
LHAFQAREWQWAASLIEQKSLQVTAYTWGASEHELVLLREWLGQLPAEVASSRPRLCVTCVELLWQVAPPTILENWLKKKQPDLALRRLEPVLQRATAGKRWGHVIEIRLLQALSSGSPDAPAGDAGS